MSHSDDKLRWSVLFLCTGNSCRSQMAEGWVGALHGDLIEAYSAGIEQHGMNADAVAVMAEVGIDISSQTSKTVDQLSTKRFDVVFTVCRNANENCPTPWNQQTKVEYVGFDDPPKLAASAVTQEEKLVHYRRVRDEIRAFVDDLPNRLRQLGPVTDRLNPI